MDTKMLCNLQHQPKSLKLLSSQYTKNSSPLAVTRGLVNFPQSTITKKLKKIRTYSWLDRRSIHKGQQTKGLQSQVEFEAEDVQVEEDDCYRSNYIRHCWSSQEPRWQFLYSRMTGVLMEVRLAVVFLNTCHTHQHVKSTCFVSI